MGEDYLDFQRDSADHLMIFHEINRNHSFLPDDSNPHLNQSSKRFSIPNAENLRYQDGPLSSKTKKRVVNVKRKVGLLDSPSIEGNIDLNTDSHRPDSNLSGRELNKTIIHVASALNLDHLHIKEP